MIHALSVIYSLPFVVGALIGILGQRLYCLSRARWLDRQHPLSDGRQHDPGGLNRVWLAGLVTAIVFGYVLLQTEQTHLDTVALSDKTRACQIEFNKALKDRAAITSKNDELSVRQRELLSQLNDASGTWINRLLNPPEDIARLDMNNPRRVAWNVDVTRTYYEWATKLRAETVAIRKEQTQVLAQRNANPYPEPTCGT